MSIMKYVELCLQTRYQKLHNTSHNVTTMALSQRRGYINTSTVDEKHDGCGLLRAVRAYQSEQTWISRTGGLKETVSHKFSFVFCTVNQYKLKQQFSATFSENQNPPQ